MHIILLLLKFERIEMIFFDFKWILFSTSITNNIICNNRKLLQFMPS